MLFEIVRVFSFAGSCFYITCKVLLSVFTNVSLRMAYCRVKIVFRNVESSMCTVRFKVTSQNSIT